MDYALAINYLMSRPGDGALIGEFLKQLREGPLSEFYAARRRD